MAPLDIITINNNGSIDRLATNDNFDIVQNQDGSKSFQVDHKDGKSQIGQVQTAVSEQNSVDFLVIQDKGIAEQFFEFAADFSTTEYSLDSFSFADGFSTNTITFGESPTGGALGGQVTPIGQFSKVMATELQIMRIYIIKTQKDIQNMMINQQNMLGKIKTKI